MRRLLRWLAGLVAALVVVAGLGAWWLLARQDGLSLALERLGPHLPPGLTIARAEGPLGGPWRLHDLRYVGTDGLAVTVARADVEWTPAALLARRLQLGRVAVAGVAVRLPATTQDAAASPPVLPSPPLAVYVGALDVASLTVSGPQSASRTVDRLRFSGRYDGRGLRLDRLQVEAAEGGVELTGDVRAGASLRHDLAGTWTLALPAAPASGGRFTLAGDGTRTALGLHLAEPLAAAVEVAVDAPFEALRWEGRMAFAGADPSLIDARLPRWPLDATLQLSGTTARYGGTVTARLDHPELGRVDVDARLAGDPRQLALEALTLRLDDGARQLHLASARVGFDRAPLQFAAEGSWEHLAWPPRGAEALASRRGRFAIDGTQDAYHLVADGELLLPGRADFPALAWSLDGRGDMRALRLDALELRPLDGGGRVAGRGEVAWAPALRFALEVAADTVDTGRFLPAWPGRVDGPLRVAGGADGAVAVDLDGLRVRLRGTPFTVRGALRRGADGALSADALALASGGASARLDGRLVAPLEVTWRVEVPDAGELLPGYAGRVTATGTLAGDPAAPRVAASGVAQALDLGAAGRAARLRFAVAAVLGDPAGALDVTLEADGLALAGQALGRARLAVQGTTRSHGARLALDDGAVTAAVELQGGYVPGRWTGRVAKARVGAAAPGNWTLQAPITLAAALAEVAVGQGCWRRDGEDAGTLCAGGTWRDDGTWRATLAGRHVPLALAERWLPRGAALAGSIDAALNLAVDAVGVPPRGQGSLVLSAGSLLPGDALPGAQTLAFSGGSGTLALDGDGAAATLRIDLAGAGLLAGHVALPGVPFAWPLPATTPLVGRFELAIDDLAPLARLLPALAVQEGRLRGELGLAGTYGEPRASGRVALSLPRVELPVAGVTLTGVESVVTATGGDRLAVSGTAHSGDGLVAIDGTLRLDPAAGWPLELAITGRDFLAADLPELRLLVEPDLQLRLAGRALSLEGTLRVPEAEIRPRRGQGGLRRASRDAVVVGRDVPAQTPPFAATSRIALELGDRVRFEGFGLKARIGGRVEIVGRPGAAARGRGELRIEQGEYSGYGSPLQVERGRLLFADGPLDDPGIDASAVRRVGDVSAGVRLRGTLSDPQVTLYSTPPMAQADILGYLVLGTPLQASTDAQGGEKVAAAAAALGFVADSPVLRDLRRQLGIEEFGVETGGVGEQVSLVLGKHLSPDIYVGYVVGLTEPTSLFRIRYRLSERWSVEAESGTHSGADINFSIER